MSDFPSVSKHLVWEGSERPHVLTRSSECSGGEQGSGHEEEDENSPYQKAAEPL